MLIFEIHKPAKRCPLFTSRIVEEPVHILKFTVDDPLIENHTEIKSC